MTTQCFTAGSPAGTMGDPQGLTFLKFCITSHGNLSYFESPAGKVHMRTREGYVVCSNIDAVVHGFDAGDVENGWGEPTMTQPGGPGTLPLTIVRNSQDGKVQLTQTFTMNAPAREVVIEMSVKNLASTTLPHSFVTRYFDGDIDNGSADDTFEPIFDSVWGTASLGQPFKRGLMLTQNASTFRPEASAQLFQQWYANGSGKQEARSCRGGSAFGFEADMIGRLAMDVGDIQPGHSKVVSFRYKRI
jgi:hypothetical protein